MSNTSLSLVQRVAALNPAADGIGAVAVAQLVAEARRVLAEHCPDAIERTYTYSHGDGHVRRYKVSVDLREVTRAMARHARHNKSRKAREVGGAVVVQELPQ